jgi:hypothetical protein
VARVEKIGCVLVLGALSICGCVFSFIAEPFKSWLELLERGSSLWPLLAESPCGCVLLAGRASFSLWLRAL